jgi:hypothetical protein
MTIQRLISDPLRIVSALLLSAAPMLMGARVSASSLALPAAQGTAASADPKATAKDEPKEGNVGLLGKDNISLARELYKRGYVDLAERVCRAVETGGKSGAVDKDELTAVRALYLDLRLDAIRSEPDPLVRKDQVEEILKEKEAFIANNIRSSEAKAAQETLPDVYRLLGEALIAAIKKETDDGKRAALREEGQQAFDRAIETLRERRDRLKQQMDDLTEEAPNELLWSHRDAMYNLARTYYFNSLLYPQGDSQQIVSLDRAKEEFNEFDLSYGDQLLAYDGRIMLGLAYKDTGGAENEQEALSVFDSAISLRETYYTTDDGKYDMPNEAADVVSNALLQKVLLLRQLKRYDELDAACEDFYKTTDQFQGTERGLAVLAAHLDAMAEKGDSDRARELAERLDKLGAGTPWSSYGRQKLSEFLGSNALSAGADRLLSIGRSLIEDSPQRAITVLHQARAAATGDKNEANLGAEALYLIGQCYRRSDNPFAAAVAFEAASDLFPTGALAPNALVESTKSWRELYKDTKYTTLKERIDLTQDNLLKRYPNHPEASGVLLRDCKDLESEKKYLEAAQCYLSIKVDSGAYNEAQVRAAQMLYQHASFIVNQEKRPIADAKSFIDQVEPILQKALPAIEGEMAKTLDLQLQSRSANLGFQARKVLASTHLLAQGSELKALKALEPVESVYGAYPNFVGQAWSLRIVAHQKRGSLSEAIQTFDSLVSKDPESPAVAAAAGVLADALNDQANAERAKKFDSLNADDLQKKAANYYRIHVAPMLRGETASAERLSEVGKNLFIYGLDINRVGSGKSQVTFVGWTPTVRNPDLSYFKDSARVLEFALQLRPSYQNSVFLGRSLGFLKEWKRAGEVYAKLFEQERIIDPKTDSISPSTIKNRAELLSGYLEYGVAEHMNWKEDNDKNRLGRAKGIYTTLAKTYREFPDTAMYWQSRFQLCRLLADAGEYDECDVQIRNVESNISKDFDEGKFGYKDDFLQLRAEIAPKLRRVDRGAAAPADADTKKPR